MSDIQKSCEVTSARYRVLIESVYDWVWEVDAEGVYTYSSPQVKVLTGYNVTEIIGRTPFDLMPAEEARRVGEIFSIYAQKKQKITKLVNQNTHKKGHKIYLETSATPIISDSGDLIGYRGIDRDVTDRVEAENALKESERRFRSIFNTMSDIYFQTELDGAIVTVTPSVEMMLGYDPEVLRGKNTRALYVDEKKRDQLIEALRETGSVNDFEVALRHKNGNIVQASITAQISGSYGGCERIEGILRDITKRKDAEAERVKLSRVVEQSDISVMITDAGGSIEYVNQAFEEMTGYSGSEIVGRPASVLKSGKQNEGFYKQLWKTISGGETFHGKLKNLRKDGTIYVEEKVITPIRDDEGDIASYVSTGRDITGVEQVELQLQQSDRLASIGQLAAGVAHEINNPVGYVNSNLGTLRIYIDDLLELINAYESITLPDNDITKKITTIRSRIDVDYLKEDVRSLVQESEEGLSHVRGIVQSLKDFSRADQGEEYQYSNIHKGLDNTLNIVYNEIKYKAELIKQYGDIPDIECSPSQINQVFMNLLINAAHAILERGKVIIRTGCDAEEEEVWIQIEDTGCGIPADKLGKIFEPFYTSKPVGKGTGLGLSLSYGIIQGHGGNIDVKSIPGEGTTFTITLPVSQGLRTEGNPVL